MKASSGQSRIAVKSYDPDRALGLIKLALLAGSSIMVVSLIGQDHYMPAGGGARLHVSKRGHLYSMVVTRKHLAR